MKKLSALLATLVFLTILPAQVFAQGQGLVEDFNLCVQRDACDSKSTPQAVQACQTNCQNLAYENNNAANLSTGWYAEPTVTQYNKAVNDCKDTSCLESTGLAMLNDFFQGTGRAILGDPTQPLNTNSSGMIKSPSAVGFFANSLSSFASNPPASGIEYVAYSFSKVRVPGSPTPAYAQGLTNGIGYQKLSPLLNIWTASRNLAYILVGGILVIAAFMIMFRVKIDPKTVVSIQSAIPKLIFALIAITFSYAIVGFMIDIMYLLIAVLVNVFRLGIGTPGLIEGGAVTTIQSRLASETIFQVFGELFLASSIGAAQAINNAVYQLVGAGSNAFSGVLGVAAGAIGWFIIAIAILWALFRTWLSLLGAYIQIVLGLISAPLYLMVEAVPGQSVFGKWLRTMLANILVFPFVVVMILVGTALVNAPVGDFGSASGGFVPPLIGGNDIISIRAIIGIGVILTLPKAIDILQEFLKAPPFKYGNAWQEAVKVGGGATQRGILNVGRNFNNAAFGEPTDQFRIKNKAAVERGLPQPTPGVRANIGMATGATSNRYAK